MVLLYEHESYQRRGAAFDVYKQLGCGHKEVVYQRATHLALTRQGLTVEREKQLPVVFDNVVVGTYVPDFLVNSNIIVELKAKPVLLGTDLKQFWQYLQSTDYTLGFLINFGHPGEVQIIRRVYDTARRGKTQKVTQRNAEIPPASAKHKEAESLRPSASDSA